ncbi:MAG TPA: ATP-binding protein [bacterium]|nr:ATP-binding protein [bacterium]HQP99776.1 ATP-binding protein [bacterium]
MLFAVESLDLQEELRVIEASLEPTLRRIVIPAEIRISHPINTRGFYHVNPNYLWLFAFLSEVEFELSEQVERIYCVLNSNVIVALLENAFSWGNKRNPRRPILVDFHVGRTGVLVRIQDDGPGFAYRHVVGKYHDQDFGDCGEFENTGYGLRIMDRTPMSVIYEGKGDTVYIIDYFREGAVPHFSLPGQQALHKVGSAQ